MKKLLKLSASVIAVSALTHAASAAYITGSVAFDGSVALDAPIPSATSFLSFDNAKVSTGTQSGDYLGSVGSAVMLEPLQFSPYVAPTNPLWSFSFGGKDFSFTFEDMVSTGSEALGAGLWRLDVAGTGTAMISGYDPTPGAFSITTTGDANATELGFGAFTFTAGSDPAPETVPDSGTSAALLGLGLLCAVSASRWKRNK
ncbi:VPDSG-CTERM sorting domain-containing protein [Pelagicoccus sp. SDUM812002]|uniref:VPDSG-CTERM sorting domain-containing protein n=1 Tax=Pelagicoccus sp. SDUM812002 TaxID=3041266 RepID=UPI00280CF5FC|nr:VPDSG-CTERM sorting domain-containing protein [Pelagicoccus sp. SDUM812002]MDQ8185901.1 VPDSG-CTERM sorting domain-containing protein [Pelagicoccus sp. SDUM812002]